MALSGSPDAPGSDGRYHSNMATYLVRCAEIGREQQVRYGKLRRDLAAVIAERIADA